MSAAISGRWCLRKQQRRRQPPIHGATEPQRAEEGRRVRVAGVTEEEKNKEIGTPDEEKA